MTGHEFFYIGLSLMLVHEMDAIRCKEWHIFPGLSLLNDRLGYFVFMLAHVPLLFFLFYELNKVDNERFITWLSIFFIIHLGLHILFLKHRKNRFIDWISWTIISTIAICGLIDIIFFF